MTHNEEAVRRIAEGLTKAERAEIAFVLRRGYRRGWGTGAAIHQESIFAKFIREGLTVPDAISPMLLTDLGRAVAAAIHAQGGKA